MPDPLQTALDELARGLEGHLTEDEIERYFQKIYNALGYTQPGRDIRGKRASESGIPDVVLINPDGSFNAVIELKNPNEDLADHEHQILDYLRELKPANGLLSNGHEFWFYNDTTGWLRPIRLPVSLKTLRDDQSSLRRLAKRNFDLADIAVIEGRIPELRTSALRPANLDDIASLFFLEAFSLSPGSAFLGLVTSLFRLHESLGVKSRFLNGSFSFWRKFHARQMGLEDAPEAWLPLLPRRTEQDLYRFMFVLESAYVVCARLILSKAVQDKDVQHILVRSALDVTILTNLRAEVDARTGKIRLGAYAAGTQRLFDSYSRSLFYQIFSEDIFDWWTDHTLADETCRHDLDAALARIILVMLRFDFSSLDADLLGELYQRYFDPDTRKALGEFYTPPELVDFILDRVGYEGRGRLLDPACGSGTFLIRALGRYLRANVHRDPVEVLRGLTDEFLLVGFDVNPFAVLMSEINLAAMLVPLYARAVASDPQVVLRRLPVIQTDSLRQEFREGDVPDKALQLGMDFGATVITVRVDLPVSQGNEPLQINLTVPRLEAALAAGLVRNPREWLQMLQAMFAAIGTQRRTFDPGADEPGLLSALSIALRRTFVQAETMARSLLPHAQGIWGLIAYLRQQHGDGRFLKTLEDIVTGLILKHDLQYKFVVGNPPYVRIQNLPERQRANWQSLYSWTRGNFDIYLPFLERPLATDHPWLEESGTLGYVISNSFLVSEAGQPMRRELPRVARLLSFTDFKATRFQDGNLFSEAMTYTCVIIAQRVVPRGDYLFPVVRFNPMVIPSSKASAIERVSQQFVRMRGMKEASRVDLEIDGTVFADSFLAKSQWQDEHGWYFMPDDERKLFNIIDDLGDQQESQSSGISRYRRLISYTATASGGFAGVQTSLDEVMVLRVQSRSSGVVVAVPRGGREPVEIEEAATRRFLFGSNVWRWKIQDQGWVVLFPYFEHTGKWHLVPSNEYWDFQRDLFRGRRRTTERVFGDWPSDSPRLETHFPKLARYLATHESPLRNREGGRFARGKRDEWRWYDLAYPRSLSEATGPKIVAQLLARSRQFAADVTGKFLFQAGGRGGGVYGISPAADADLWFLLGLLNSEVADFYIRHTTQFYNPSGSASYGDTFLKNVPIPKVPRDLRTRLETSARKLVEKLREQQELEDRLKCFPDSVFTYLREKGSPATGDELGRLADVSGLPRMIVGASLRTSNLLDGRVELRSGRGTVRLAGAIAEVLRRMILTRRAVSRDELVKTFVPDTDAGGERFVAIALEWEVDLRKLGRCIETLEKAYNADATRAYGIDDSQMPVLRRFLDRF